MAEQVEKNTLEQIAEDIEQPVEEVKEEEEPQETDSDVITEEYVKEAGLPESFVGKKFSDGTIAKHIKSLTGEFTKKSQKASELEKRLESLEAKMTEGKTKQEKEEVKDLFEKMPDPLDNPDQFKAWMKDALNEAETKAEKRALEKVESEYGNIKKDSAERKREEFLDNLKQKLPTDVDPIEAIDEWAEKSGWVKTQEDIDYFLGRPAKMIDLVTDYYAQKEGLDKVREKGDDKLERVKKNLKSTTGSELNTHERKTKEGGVLADLADDLALKAGMTTE